MLIEPPAPPEPRRGDVLALPATGAYTLATSSTYNALPRPAAVLAADGHAGRSAAARVPRIQDLLWRSRAERQPAPPAGRTATVLAGPAGVAAARAGEPWCCRCRVHRRCPRRRCGRRDARDRRQRDPGSGGTVGGLRPAAGWSDVPALLGIDHRPDPRGHRPHTASHDEHGRVRRQRRSPARGHLEHAHAACERHRGRSRRPQRSACTRSMPGRSVSRPVYLAVLTLSAPLQPGAARRRRPSRSRSPGCASGCGCVARRLRTRERRRLSERPARIDDGHLDRRALAAARAAASALRIDGGRHRFELAARRAAGALASEAGERDGGPGREDAARRRSATACVAAPLRSSGAERVSTAMSSAAKRSVQA